MSPDPTAKTHQAPVPPWDDQTQLIPILESLLLGDLKQAEHRVRMVAGPAPELEQLYLSILDPIMVEIGQRWETGRISTAQEHLASALVTRMMCAAYSRIKPEPRPDLRGVVCCGPGELHQIGAWMVADLLELAGWDVRFLGADTPADGILEQIAAFRPQVFFLSCSVPSSLRAGAQLVEQVRQMVHGRELAIMAGGAMLRNDPGLALTMGADGTAKDGRGAVRQAEAWREGFRAR